MTHPLIHLDWLFYYSQNKTNKGLSSTTCFSPVHAASDDAWQSTTTPSARQNKKAIVLTKNIFDRHPIDFFALAEWLRRDGFAVYLCLPGDEEKGNKFHLFEGSVDAEKLDCLSDFDEKGDRDYNTLAEYVARDHVVVLDAIKERAIRSCLEKPSTPDPNSNAVSTVTTLRFHSYSSEFLKVEDIITARLAATKNDEKNILSEQICFHMQTEKRFSDFYLPMYLECLPSNAEELWECFKKGGGEVTGHYLERCLAAWPAGSKKLWANLREKKRKRSVTTYELSLFLTFFPEEADEWWTYFTTNNSSLDWPAGAEKVWGMNRLLEYYNTILKEHGPCYKVGLCLTAFGTGATKKWNDLKQQCSELTIDQLSSLLYGWPAGGTRNRYVL